MALLKEKEEKILREKFSKEMINDVKIVFFNSKDPKKCDYCDLTKQILDEVSNISGGKVKVESYIFEDNKTIADEYGIEFFPGFVILDGYGKNLGVKFYGIPSGHEFGTLIEEIIIISRGANPPVSPEIAKKVMAIKKPFKLQAFVTPTCPHCPGAVIMSHFFAMLNPNITGEMIEANEFSELSMKYGVSAVPQVVINDGEASFIGSRSEKDFYKELEKLL